jgi:hypothetical protein
MTGPRYDIPQRRLRDNGRGGELRAWVRDAWWSWGQPVFGVVVIIAAVAVFIVALQVRSLAVERSHDEQATAKAARQSCERARALGPSLVKDYEIRGVLTGENLELYRSLIPKTCPK